MLFINQNGTLKNVQVTYRKAKQNKTKQNKTPPTHKEMRNRENEQKPKTKMSDFSTNLSIITLSVNGLNIPIKRDRQNKLEDSCTGR